MLTGAKRLLPVREREAEHHLDTQQKRLKIPYDGRPLKKRDVVAGRNAVKGHHCLPVYIPRILVYLVIVVVVIEGCAEDKRPILQEQYACL